MKTPRLVLFPVPRRVRAAGAMALAALCTAAAAVPVTSLPGAMPVPMPVLAQPQTRGPVSFSEGLVWSATSLASSFGDTRRQNLGENGDWSGAAGPYAALGAAEGSMTITFPTPVRGVGALLNFAPPAGPFTIAVHGLDGAVLESSTLAFPSPCIPSPGCSPSATVDAGEFHGFLRGSAEIASFTMSDAYVVMRGLQVTMVPEPHQHVLLLAGLGVLALSIRRIRR